MFIPHSKCVLKCSCKQTILDMFPQIENYQEFSESYKRIRIAYIDAARKRPKEFEKRLKSFLSKTREKKMIVGFGGIDKYYK